MNALHKSDRDNELNKLEDRDRDQKYQDDPDTDITNEGKDTIS